MLGVFGPNGVRGYTQRNHDSSSTLLELVHPASLGLEDRVIHDAMSRRSSVAILTCATVCFGQKLCFSQQPVDIGHQAALDLQAGKYDEAKVLVDHALRETPRDPRLWALDGITLVRLNQKDQALDSFRHALQLSPDYLPALEGAAQLEYEVASDEAVPLLKRILKQRPGDRTSHAMLAEIAFKRGDCEMARDEYAASQLVSTRSAGALKEFGSCLVRQKRMLEAVPVFERLSELEPESSRALYELAVVQFLNGRYSAVIKILESIIIRGADADALALLGEAYEVISDTEHAIGALRRAIATSPNVSEYYADLAYIYQAHRDFQQGIAVVDAGLERNPNAASLYVARGILYSELAQFDKGLADFNTAETLDANVELGSEARGLIELQRNDLPEAERIIRERIRRHPDDAFLYYLLGESLRKKGTTTTNVESEQVVNAFVKAIELDPQLTLARDALAAIYLAQGKASEAIAQSRAAYRANPTDQTALYHLVLALRKQGQTNEVPELLKELTRLKKQNQPQEFLGEKVTIIDQQKTNGAPVMAPQ